jgi:hypothetical protein
MDAGLRVASNRAKTFNRKYGAGVSIEGFEQVTFRATRIRSDEKKRQLVSKGGELVA